MQKYTQRSDDAGSPNNDKDNSDTSGHRPEDIERQTAPTQITQVPSAAHPWLHDYHYVVVGFMGDGSVPRETLRRVMHTEGLFQAIRKAHRFLRNPVRRALSLKEVSGFGIYECDPAKGYHREVELDRETERALSELWRSYKGNKLDYEGRWLMWIHEHFNADSKNPEVGGLTLEFKLRWSVIKVVFWGTVPIVLSLVIGFWYMFSDHGDVDDVAVAEAAWVIATYIVTSSACEWLSSLPQTCRLMSSMNSASRTSGCHYAARQYLRVAPVMWMWDDLAGEFKVWLLLHHSRLCPRRNGQNPRASLRDDAWKQDVPL